MAEGFTPVQMRPATKDVAKVMATEMYGGIAQHRVITQALREFAARRGRDDLAQLLPVEDVILRHHGEG